MIEVYEHGLKRAAPCRKCLSTADTDLVYWASKDAFQVMCHRCLMWGPGANTVGEAVKVWNAPDESFKEMFPGLES